MNSSLILKSTLLLSIFLLICNSAYSKRKVYIYSKEFASLKLLNQDSLLNSTRVQRKSAPNRSLFDTTQVKNVMFRVANWQLKHPPIYKKLNWGYGTFCAGLWAFYELTDKQRYANVIRKIGRKNHWHLMNPIYMADHLTIGQSYLDLYMDNHNKKIIETMKWAAGMYLKRDAPADVRYQGNPYRLEWWSWCDALFMAPPFFAKMYKATDNIKYLDYMNKHWWLTSHYLYDSNAHLFYRDDRYFSKREPNGKKVFWSRGNGWVMAGLARILQDMPRNYPFRAQFVNQFKEMAQKIVSIQSSDGLWRTSLLDPKEYNVGESSGSALFCFALAWGINNKVLKKNKYKQAAMKAWQGLLGHVNKDGRLGYVQQPAGSPNSIKKNQYAAYGAGAFLLAGRQIYHLLKNNIR